MHRAPILAALGMIGCGRLGFGASPPGDGPDSPGDAPPVPVSICKVDRIPLPAMPPTADLAIAPIGEGYAAFWVDATAASAAPVAHGVVLGPNHQLLLSTALPNITDIALGGATDAGEKLMLASSNGRDETLWVVERDLSKATAQTTLTGHVMGHDPYPSDAGHTDRAFVTALADKINISLVASDGLANLGASSQFGADGPITDLACTDGPNHSHCVWAATPASGTPECIITDVYYMGSLAPVVGSHLSIAPGCSQIRNASGPVQADSMIVVWVDAAGAVQAHYAASAGNADAMVNHTGSAPKVQFDGTRFWIAWLDGTGELRLSQFELPTGALIHYALPGWVPNGPEAFELVTRGNETGLVLLSPSGLDFLTICT